MGDKTGIQWTDHTFNPWWGCAHVSPGCDHCYAETLAARFGTGWGNESPRRFFGIKHWNEPIKWNASAAKLGKPAKVFCASMADVFEDRPDLVPEREKLWQLIDNTPWLVWQLLTKRPQNIARMVPTQWLNQWPLNVWPGTSIEDGANEKRAKFLHALPACTAFVSIEPMIGPVNMHNVAGFNVRWAILGGESGHGARYTNPQWMLDAAALAGFYGIYPFVKQLGTPAAIELGLKDKKGGDWNEWPLTALRVREFPPISAPVRE